MKLRLHILLRSILAISMVSVSFTASGLALALESNEAGNNDFEAWSDTKYTQRQSAFEPNLESVIRPLRWVKNDNRKFRSKAEVMSEVKNRYKAKVLRISLNEKSGVYNVRILLPSGKVKNVQLSARR
ncbi:MAG: putative membrane protein YkoI [Arenicella sp.]|jgi:uncharacterized membrane protein YkoI